MKAHIGVGADSGLMHTVIGGGSSLGYMEAIRPVRIGDGHTGALALLRIGPQGTSCRRMGLQGASTIDARQGHITARLIDIGAREILQNLAVNLVDAGQSWHPHKP